MMITSKISRKNMRRTGFLVLFLLFTAAVLLTGGVSAEKSIVVDVPTSAVKAGEVVTIPVVMYGAENIAGFKMYVYNDVEGTTITVNDNQPLADVVSGMYTVNSDAGYDRQVVVWATSSTSGFSGDCTLFSVDVLTSKDSPETIPVRVSVAEKISDVDLNNVRYLYPITIGSLIVDGANPSAQSAGLKNESTVVSPVTPDAEQANVSVQPEIIPSPSEGQSDDEVIPPSEQLPQSIEQPSGIPDETNVSPTSSPVSLSGVLAAFGFLLFADSRRRK